MSEANGASGCLAVRADKRLCKSVPTNVPKKKRSFFSALLAAYVLYAFGLILP